MSFPQPVQRSLLTMQRRLMSTTSSLPASRIPIHQDVEAVRTWRQAAFDKKETVGFVPTMGALHQGHLDLVRQSLRTCDHTVVSIFVNPTQFAPTEDLASYPRTLQADLSALEALSGSHHNSHETSKTVSALFMPPPNVMYPSGFEQDVSKQKGAFVEVQGFAHQMEGKSRPTFFRGVATVVLKLLNIVQPTKAFFGQKDIQQAILLRQMVKDLWLPNPALPQDLVIAPTVRDPESKLALSSRNAYLTDAERPFAPTLVRALEACSNFICQSSAEALPAEAIVEQGLAVVAPQSLKAQEQGVAMKLDYIALNNAETLEPITTLKRGEPAIISGALYVGKTRLIDNFVLNKDLNA